MALGKPGDVPGEFTLAFNSGGTLNLQRVGTAGNAAAGNDFDIAYIVNAVFDQTTNTIRYVEVG